MEIGLIVPLAVTASLHPFLPLKPVDFTVVFTPARVHTALIAQSESTIGGDGGNSFSWNSLNSFVVNVSDVTQTVIVGNNGRENTIVVGPRSYKNLNPLYRKVSDLKNQSLSWNGKTLYFDSFRTNDRRGNKYDGGYIVGKEIGNGFKSYPLEVGWWVTPQGALDKFRVQQQQQQQRENLRREEEARLQAEAERRRAEEARLQAEAERRRAELQAEQDRAKQLEAERQNQEAQRRFAEIEEAKRRTKEQRDREKTILLETGTKAIDSLLNILFK